MSDQKFTLGIVTIANTSGAEKAVTALEQVEDKGRDAAKALDDTGKSPGLKNVPADARAAAGSLDALEEEVRALGRELGKLPVGSQQFVSMAGKVKEAQAVLSLAEAEARKLGGTIGHRGNAGMAVLEFSRAFEDAQYGIRGVLNNIPGLITMLGGGAGLAGIISIAAVAGTQLWERLADTKKAEDSTSKFVNDTKKLLGELKKSLEAVSVEQGKLTGDTLEKSFAARKVAVEREKTTMDNYNAVLRTSIELEGKLAKFQTTAALRKVDQQQREGTLTPEEGDRKRLDIQIGAVKDDDLRQRELIALETQKVETQKQAAIQAKLIAEDELKRGQARLKAQQAEEESLKKQIQLRTNLDKQREKLQAMADKNETTSPRDAIVQTGKRLKLDPADPLEYDKILAAIQSEGEELAKSISAINQRIATEAPSPVQSIQKKNPDGSDGELVKPRIVKRAEDLEKGDPSKGVESLAALSSKVVDLTGKAEAAAVAVTKANDALEQQMVVARQKEVGLDINNLNNPALQGVEQKAGEATRQLMEEVLARIPEGAKGPEVNAVVDKIKQLTGDGQQRGEAGEAQQLLMQLQAKIAQGDSQRAVLYQKIIATTDAAITALSAVTQQLGRQSTQIDEINRTITGIKNAATQRNP